MAISLDLCIQDNTQAKIEERICIIWWNNQKVTTVRGRHVSCKTYTHYICTRHDRVNQKNTIIERLDLK